MFIPACKLHLIHCDLSVRIDGFPFTVKSRISCYGDAHLLDTIRVVGICVYSLVYLDRISSFSINGYISSRVYASLGGTDHRKTMFFSATLVPTLVLSEFPFTRVNDERT